VGAFALVEGLFTLSGVTRGEVRSGTRKWPLVTHGVAGVLTGLIAFFWPSITTLALLYIIALGPVHRLLELGDAYRLRKAPSHDWMLARADAEAHALVFTGPRGGVLRGHFLPRVLEPAAEKVGLPVGRGAGSTFRGCATPPQH
jgi:hypothetical protein